VRQVVNLHDKYLEVRTAGMLLVSGLRHRSCAAGSCTYCFVFRPQDPCIYGQHVREAVKCMCILVWDVHVVALT
jgi:hypothetical protein